MTLAKRNKKLQKACAFSLSIAIWNVNLISRPISDKNYASVTDSSIFYVNPLVPQSALEIQTNQKDEGTLFF